jgi:hypothetical protein
MTLPFPGATYRIFSIFLLTCIIHKFRVGETKSMNASRGMAGMDEATIVGLRERIHPGLPPYITRFMNNAG